MAGANRVARVLRAEFSVGLARIPSTVGGHPDQKTREFAGVMDSAWR